jgi:hypothetical protein
MTSWRDVGTQQISGPLIQEICAPSRIRHVFIMPIPMVSSGLDSDSDQTSYRSYRCTRMILFASIRQGITARDIGWKVRDVCCDALTVSSLLVNPTELKFTPSVWHVTAQSVRHNEWCRLLYSIFG